MVATAALSRIAGQLGRLLFDSTLTGGLQRATFRPMAKKVKTKKKSSKKAASRKKAAAKAKKPATWKPKPVEGIGWPAFRYQPPS